MYKRIAPVVQHGDLHRLLPPDGDATGGLAVRRGRRRRVGGVLLAAARRTSVARYRPVRLRGLDPAARYRDEETGEVHHGAVLLGHGLHPQLPPGDYASAVMHLVRA